MKLSVVFLSSILLLLSACGGGENASADSGGSKQDRAKVAEVNLTRIRDAVLKFYEAKKEVPMSVTHLEDYGGGENDLEPSSDYADIGYAFYSVKFDDQGKMTQGWFIATPVLESGALKVRMNGVTGEFDYVPQEDDFGPAPSTLPSNTPEE